MFDVRSNAAQVWVGTDDNGATDSDPSGGGAAGNNMVQGDRQRVRQRRSRRRQQPDPEDPVRRWLDLARDHHALRLARPAAPIPMARSISTQRSTTTTWTGSSGRTPQHHALSGNLVARSHDLYDDQSRVYQTIRYGVDPSTGAVGNALTDNSWFDLAGNVLKSLPSGSQLFTKSVYDGLGRVTTQYSELQLDETAAIQRRPMSTNDTIMEQWRPVTMRPAT